MIEFLLPDVGEGLAEAEIIDWLVTAGDQVHEGQPMVEISTDKVTVELPAPCDGTVRALHAAPGDVVPVGVVLLTIDEAEAGQGELASPVGAAHRPTAARPPETASTSTNGLMAAPTTRRRAAQLGVDLRTVVGSGPGGRILRADVEARARQAVPAATAVPASAPFGPTDSSAAHPTPRTTAGPATRPSGVRRERLSGVRATAADRMSYSARTYATSTSTFEVAGDGLLRLAAVLEPDAQRAGVKLGVLPLLIAAVARVLTRHPRVNATIDESSRELLCHEEVRLGVAVATGAGLVVPVLREAATRRPLELAAELADLADRARAGRLQSRDMADGTFTVSSTGGLEEVRMLSTAPVINAPQTATLWCSRITTRPRVTDGQLEAGPMMTCSLSFDHRYLDGAEVTRLLNDLAGTLATPERAFA